MSILSILNQLASTSSRLEKEAILLANKNNKTLRRTFELALDPILNFYIKKVPEPRYSDLPVITLEHSYDCVLEALSTRKVTGNAAIVYLCRLVSALDKDDATVLSRVIDRDLRCGVQAATVNKIWPGAVAEFNVMLASKISDIKIEDFPFPAYVQKKSDGMRVQIFTEGDNVRLFSRNGKELFVHGVFDSELTRSDYVYDGELLVYDDRGNILPRTIGNGICNKAIKGTISEVEASRLVVVLWDCIPIDDWKDGKSRFSYDARLQMLEATTQITRWVKRMETHHVDSMDEVHNLYKKYRAAGDEGVMLKDPNGIWEAKRVKHQVKFKGVYDADLMCVGWEPGTKKNDGKIGAYLLESDCGKMKVSVGTGLSDKDREADPQYAIGKIIAIQYNDIVKDKRSDTYSLFLPRFLEVREDKETADTLEDLIKQVKEED